MRLLVSVVDATEAIEAVAAGADIVDVKDPTAGALGRAAPSTIRAIRAATPGGLPVSAALGDGPFEARAAVDSAAAAAAAGASFVKLGLRQTPVAGVLPTLLAVRAALPETASLIVAGFADAARTGSPAPEMLPDLARSAGAQGCLLDTGIKDGRGLFDWLADAALVGFVQDCRRRGLLSALAGSLALDDLPRLRSIDPDIVGVRGAACVGDRVRGRVSGDRVRALVWALAPPRATSGAA
jgi:(5-formylfuran-3-yl)methyl phosphate synthase